MRQLTASEILSLNKFLEMETNSLAMAKISVNAIGDDQLRNLAQSGISASEGRIKGLQQFIHENNVTAAANTAATISTPTNNVYNTSNVNNVSSTTDNNLPKGVM
jgi:hypothetical protein